MHNRYTEDGTGRKAGAFLLQNIETDCGVHPPHCGIGIEEFSPLERMRHEAEYSPPQGAKVNDECKYRPQTPYMSSLRAQGHCL
jgi:hypothetical protein